MSIPTQCPRCNRRFAAPDQLLGKGVRCPQCGNQFLVQAATAPAGAGAIQPRPSPASAPALAPILDPEGNGRKFPVKNILMGAGVLVGLFVLIFVAYALLSDSGGWREYASKEGGFVVLMPGNPSPQEKNDSQIGHKLQEITQPFGLYTFSVQYYDVPYRPINDYLVRSRLKHLLVTEKSGKLAWEQPLTLDKYQGSEFVVELPDQQMVARRVFVVNSRTFLVTAQFPAAPTYPPAVERFLESFKVTDVPAMPSATLASVNAPPPATFVAKGTPLPTPPEPKKGKDGFVVSPEEQTVIDLINRFRQTEKVKPLRIERRLVEGARNEANQAARRKQMSNANYGYQSISRMTMPGRDLTPEQLVDQLINSGNKVSRVQMADEEKDDIGVGISTYNGITYYVIIMGGNAR